MFVGWEWECTGYLQCPSGWVGEEIAVGIKTRVYEAWFME